MATLDQIAQALKAADAAGDTASAQRLAQAYRQQQTAQDHPNRYWAADVANPFDQFDAKPQGNPFDKFDAQPQSNALSNAYRQALLSGDTVKAHQIAVQARAQNVPIAPVSDSDINQSVDQRFAQNVAAQNPLLTAWQGVGEGASNFYGGIKQHVYDPVADAIDGGNRSAQAQQQVAENRRLSEALNNTAAGKVGNVAGSIASSAPLVL